MINPGVLLSPLTRQEAVLSSRIEGTIATLEEVLEHEAGQRFEKNKEDDIQEILNYREALILSSDYLNDYPVRLSLVLQTHKILMSNVRGHDKKPGEFRKSQNWIGPSKNTPIEKATFIPPHPLILMDHLYAWEKYLAIDDTDPLIQAAIAHAQFELLHPFMDGNGRIGRLIIPIFLYSKKCLSAPMFYISAYLENNREEYYSRLKDISQHGAWTEWIEFFLQAISVQAKDNINTARQIQNHFNSIGNQIRSITHSQYSLNALNSIFYLPIFSSSDFIRISKIQKPTAHTILRQLLEAKIIRILKKGEGRRLSIFAFPSLLNIVEGHPVL